MQRNAPTKILFYYCATKEWFCPKREVNSKVFPVKICSVTTPWLLVNSLTFPWQLLNPLTLPGFPDRCLTCLQTKRKEEPMTKLTEIKIVCQWHTWLVDVVPWHRRFVAHSTTTSSTSMQCPALFRDFTGDSVRLFLVDLVIIGTSSQPEAAPNEPTKWMACTTRNTGCQKFNRVATK